MEAYKNYIEIIPYLVFIVIFIFILLSMFVIVQIKTQKRLHLAEIKKSRQEMQHHIELTNKVAEIQENERKRIARIVHDDIANKISIIEILFKSITIPESKAKKIIYEQLPLIYENSRNIAHNLYPVEIEQVSFHTILNNLVYTLSDRFSTELSIDNNIDEMLLQIKLEVLRILQEFINNSVKHSGARTIKLCIKKYKNFFLIIVSDDGKGYDIENAKKGMGLQNIQYRIDILKASYKIISAPNKGTAIKILVKND